jgi:hypothetical protein
MTTPAPTKTTGNTLSIIGIVCGVLAVLFLPIVFGPAGLVLGFIGRSKGERLSTVAIIVAAVGMVLGIVIGYLILNSNS